MIKSLLIFILFLSNWYSIRGQCPSMGLHSYVLVTITHNTTYDGFLDLFDYYAQITSACGIEFTHVFHFGNKAKRTIVAQNMTSNVFGNLMPTYHVDSMVESTDIKQNDNGDLLTIMESFIKDLEDKNLSPQNVVLKKTITIITDYANTNLTEAVPSLKFDNAEAFIITPLHDNAGLFDNDTFTVCVKDAETVTSCSAAFCKDITINIKSPPVPDASKTNIYAVTFHSDLWMIRAIATSVAKGTRDNVLNTVIKRNFITVHFAQNDTTDQPLPLPWLGNMTIPFYEKCINTSLVNKLGLTNYTLAKRDTEIFNPPTLCSESSVFYKRLLSDLASNTTINGTVIVLGDKCPNCLKEIMNSRLNIVPDLEVFFRISTVSERNDIFQTFVNPVYNRLNNSARKFHTTFIELPIDITNATVANKDITVQTPLIFAKKWKYHEPWSLAWHQFFVIIALCILTAIGVGAFFYRMAKKVYVEQLAEAHEEYKEAKICLKTEENMRNDCLPWEVHIDRVCLHQDFPLGEDASSVIYLGKLKGKAPICQWINLPEMKQFQDCAVAVRVPRRYDDEEEKQLLREINAMKVIKHHDYIANLLGWFNKHNFACTIMELTHTNLLKYASQIRDSCDFENQTSSAVTILPFKQYLRIFVQICDAMSYIASKGLVHRNLTAKSVLLTTGLRAKVSGFNYCSTVGDHDFEPIKPAFYLLPIYWMAPEAMKGRFTDRSDVWSFSMLLYEVYSLGEIPFAGVRDGVLLQKTIKSGNRPSKPEFASDELYSIMTKCWHGYPERRPTFKELQTQFHTILERQYENPAFVFEHTE